MDESYAIKLLIATIIGGIFVGFTFATLLFVLSGAIGPDFDPTTDCQEVWDIYADVVGYEIDGIHYPWLGNNHRLWSKLGFTDLEVHEFEYCINHMPWKGGSG